MKKSLRIFVLALLMTAGATASAVTVTYNTTGSTLSCNGLAGCVQNTATSVTVGGLTFTYTPGAGFTTTPAIVDFGYILATGTGSNVDVSGLRLTMMVNSTPSGADGTLPYGYVPAALGTISTGSSNAVIIFSQLNTTTSFGTLPGVVVSAGGQSFTYQILNSSLGLQAPTEGIPAGKTVIQGAVSDNPASMTANAGTAPQSTVVNTAFANALAVTVTDGTGNPVPGIDVAFTAPTSGASGVFSNSTTTITVPTNASGVASAPFTANGTAGGTYIVFAASAGLTTVHFALTNTPAPVTTHFLVSAPAAATLGSAFNFTVTARDASNVTATGYSGTVHFTGTDASAIWPANATLINGVGTFSATLNTTGNQTISATDTATASITGTSSAIAVASIVQAISGFVATPPAPVFVPGGTFNVSATGGASGNPVTFSISGASASICSAGGTNGATITMLAIGTCNVLADQAGNSTYAAAAQATLAVVIGKIAATVALTSSANPSTFGSSITFAASVDTAAPAGAIASEKQTSGAKVLITVVPGGSVIFSDGATPLATVSLVGGTATYSISSLSVGSHTITAAYSGDANTAPASVTIPQVVNAGVSISSVPAPMLSTWLLGLLGTLLSAMALVRTRRA